MIQTEITNYIAEINRIFKAGNATEHSYRPALKCLMENLTSGLTVTNEPKRIDCGAPDYIVTRGEVPVGYIEAKDIGENLNDKKHKAQFDRYKQSLENLIITDYLTFQLFEAGDLIWTVTIANNDQNSIKADLSQFETFTALINSFVGYKGQTIQTSEHLSKVMAAKARLMANVIKEALDKNHNENRNSNSLEGQLAGFREVLIHDINYKEFADVYAQTIAYGMFAANINNRHSNSIFNRSVAANLIPQSNPFLRKFFYIIAGLDLDERIRWIVDDLADLFNYVDINEITKEFSKNEHDPVIHFYETFLAEYDPVLRKSRGVWYTPQPVVNFIVQAVDDILKQDFGLSQGLADASKVKIKQREGNKEIEKETHRVQILDPATGTGTFLSEVVQNIYSRFKNQQGMWQGYAAEHLIPRINGFEILMASYTMAHLKLDMLLKQTGVQLNNHSSQRLRIYLTNSLEEARAKTEIPFAQWLSDEANEASRIKEDVPVMVVLGNPPYSGESQNSGKWMNELMNDYKKEPSGIRLQEKNSKWINDDYVKFIRYGQYFIEKNGEGILAFINNHSFLDNPTFRGMRYSLLKTFDKIYILDLHGNAKKKETTPDGSPDINVFDIQQGVSINIFVKIHHNEGINHLADIYHADLYGKRSQKYNFLLNNNLHTVKWQKLDISEPQYFFVPKDFSLQKEYNKGFSVQELFTVNSVGIVTAKDIIFVNINQQELFKSISSNFNIKPDEKLIRTIAYRPFDNRYIYYDIERLERPRENVMRHFLKGENKNIGLVVSKRNRQISTGYVFISNSILDLHVLDNAQDSTSAFPIYFYTSNNIFENGKRIPNLNEEIIKKISRKLKLHFTEEKEETSNTFAPIDVLDYIYAVLHSPTYRERYKEFLKIDFPRVPYPENAEQFWHLAALGGKLRRLHLMEGVEPQEGMANFPIAGSNIVEKLKYIDNKVLINETQYFEHVPSEALNFYIGGYQPAQKWLKDRKGRKLGYDDILHYQRIIWVLKETREVMGEVDEKFI